MRFSHKYKFIFFANPKSGSTTVRQLLNPYSDISTLAKNEVTPENPFHAHMRPEEAKIEFEKKGWDYDAYFKFTTVRNPWARLVSLYEMIYTPTVRRKDRSVATKLKHKFDYLTRPTFKKWLFKVKPNGFGAGDKRRPRAMWRIHGSYSILAFIKDKDDNILVDEVVKLEELSSRLPLVFEKINLPDREKLLITKKNTGNYRSYVEYYDDESIEYVLQNYKYDIDEFNYHFGE
ncbi:MAG: sulfotransferase family protein [Desulfobacterales bacterium]|nr:sulfotransferase family protein [Desulfobacterales bacterium]